MFAKYIPLALITAALFSITACDKKLDLAPEDTMTERAALTNQTTAEAALGDAYIKLYEACKADAYVMGDFSTGLLSNFAGENNPYYTGAIDPRDPNYNPFWEKNYIAINLANVLIEKLGSIGTFDAQLKKQYIAEAKFIRAYCYSNLIRLYGDGALEAQPSNMGVPLRLQGYDGYDGSQNIPRSTNAEVFEQIFKDIDAAIPDLKAKFDDPVSTRSRATKGTANALGARVSMYARNNDKAIAYSTQVLTNTQYALAGSILDVFPNNTSAPAKINITIPELIMSFPVSWNNNPYDNHGIYFYDGFTFLSDAFIASYASKDIRATELLTTGAPWSVHLTPMKFSHPQNRDNLTAIRLAEILLTKAEALTNKNGVNQEAIDALNAIHQRAFAPADKPALYTAADFADKQQLLNAILRERRWELAGEGFDRFDFIRTGRKPNAVLPANRYVLPVPYNETAITGGVIKQNPGYN
ncbi:RagB/SusD family nutrient uptake outer membrane protein [Pseudoflavitalea sp. G-6-1-2]|uniref:RagB/SusD family nutrient uptake outer membrane protein n=1 Tax=Pseudoflavitalea sp. G-6-1-2 TaxID=2728841 RepID=UPI00146B06F7|nr:RagB/SusD family nutrient uptake outer membrane protein [Pseudoflavitalea sp. G-6-1-2]NML23907.1 RagB/SusD family nutrient uptake outer membrane protein [Pseudoflavitalea sp. G-6-1-2]